MAEFVHNTAAAEMWLGSGVGTALDLGNSSLLKVALSSSKHTVDRDDDLADDGSTSDLNTNEISGTGYAAGYGGSGRKVLASKTYALDKANDRTDFDAADITWTAIDAGTAYKAVVILEDHASTTSDTGTRVVSHHDTNFPVTTNGGDLTLQITDLIRLLTAT